MWQRDTSVSATAALCHICLAKASSEITKGDTAVRRERLTSLKMKDEF